MAAQPLVLRTLSEVLMVGRFGKYGCPYYRRKKEEEEKKKRKKKTWRGVDSNSMSRDINPQRSLCKKLFVDMSFLRTVRNFLKKCILVVSFHVTYHKKTNTKMAICPLNSKQLLSIHVPIAQLVRCQNPNVRIETTNIRRNFGSPVLSVLPWLTLMG